MSRRRKPQQRAGDWQPMQPASQLPRSADQRARLLIAAVRDGMTATEAAAYIDEQNEVWANDRYTCHVDRRLDGTVMHLSYRRNDRKAARDWRDAQRIKNDIAGREVEACELYPAQSRMVDAANQYHLWVLGPGEVFPFGFRESLVDDDADTAAQVGARQRSGAVL